MNDLQAMIYGYVKAQGITKDDFAERLGIGRTSFYNKLAGRSQWYLWEAQKLSQMLGVSLDDIARMTL